MIRFAAALASAATICVAAGGAWAASDTKVALVPGGPHPYFAAWEQAAADAKRDFGLAEDQYKVPPKWELSAQNELIESTVSQGFNAFGIFPGDAVGTNATMQELAGFGVPSIALAGCTKDPTPALFCMGTDVARSAYLGTKELLKALGNKGNIAHFTGFLVDPNTQLRIQAVEKAVGRGRRRGEGRPGDRRHRRPAARRREDQRLPRRPGQGRRRHHHHGLGPLGRGRHLAAQPRRQADQDGRHRPRRGGAEGDQGRLRPRHHAAEPLRPGLHRLLRPQPRPLAAAR